MTALPEYDRLEAEALWRAAPDMPRREVLISVGDATLAISDLSDRPLAHWSLPAIVRRDPGTGPARFAPGAEADEEIEVADETMIAAIARVQRAVERRRPNPGRLRSGLLVCALVLLVAAGALWLPAALRRLAVAVVPPALRAETGLRLLDHVATSRGAPCRAATARAPLARLAARTLGPAPARLVVLPGEIGTALHLPGDVVVLDRRLIEDQDGPETAAAAAIAERIRAERSDPMERLLETAGPGASLRLLTTGALPDGILRDHARDLLAAAPDPVPAEVLRARLSRAGLSAAPEAGLPSDVPTAEDTASDTGAAGTPRPIMTDGAWVALQDICTD